MPRVAPTLALSSALVAHGPTAAVTMVDGAARWISPGAMARIEVSSASPLSDDAGSSFRALHVRTLESWAAGSIQAAGAEPAPLRPSVLPAEGIGGSLERASKAREHEAMLEAPSVVGGLSAAGIAEQLRPR